jgi:phage-related protein
MLDKLTQLINLTIGVKNTMATNQVQLETELTNVGNQVRKVFNEVSNLKVTLEQRIAELEALILNGEITPAAQALLDALKADVQSLDDIVPDAV